MEPSGLTSADAVPIYRTPLNLLPACSEEEWSAKKTQNNGSVSCSFSVSPPVQQPCSADNSDQAKTNGCQTKDFSCSLGPVRETWGVGGGEREKLSLERTFELRAFNGVNRKLPEAPDLENRSSFFLFPSCLVFVFVCRRLLLWFVVRLFWLSGSWMFVVSMPISALS